MPASNWPRRAGMWPTALPCAPTRSFAAFGEGMDPALFGNGPAPIGGRKANLSEEIQAWAEEVSLASRPAASCYCRGGTSGLMHHI